MGKRIVDFVSANKREILSWCKEKMPQNHRKQCERYLQLLDSTIADSFSNANEFSLKSFFLLKFQTILGSDFAFHTRRLNLWTKSSPGRSVSCQVTKVFCLHLCWSMSWFALTKLEEGKSDVFNTQNLSQKRLKFVKFSFQSRNVLGNGGDQGLNQI